eukprot:TRINITY_DN7643_c0_g1_i4.p1 TRINITY_DN7643_c0_g1~~TRINITY_DN7643_c0_g1_i4.p1  ORF type:complete len:932 (-),score=229.80 TRINITY_DN7643_c0_g1_i4:121-2787(-)
MASHPLAELLESVTDAVSALVLYASEAGNRGVVLKNATASDGVAIAVNFFASQAQHTVLKWQELGTQEMAEKMDENIHELRSCTEKLVNAFKSVVRDPTDDEQKNVLVQEGKDLLKWMIAIIQQNDLYGVMLALKHTVLAQQLISDCDFSTFAVDDYDLLLESVGNQLSLRLEVTHDAKTRQILNEARSELERLREPFATVVKRSWVEPNFKTKLPVIHHPMLLTLEKAVKGIKLSAKSPFNLSLLDNELSDFVFKEDELEAITVSAVDFEDVLRAIKKAIQEGDEFELERAIRTIDKDVEAQIEVAEEIITQIANEHLRDEMTKRVTGTKTEFYSLMGKMKQESHAALLSNDPSRVDDVLCGVNKMFNTVMEGKALNEIQTSVLSLGALLDELPTVIDARNVSEAKALTKDIQNEIKVQKVMANVVADCIDEEFRKQRVLGNTRKIEVFSVAIPTSVTNSLQGVPKAREQLEKILFGMKVVSGELVTAVSVSTPQEILESAGRIDNTIRNLNLLCQSPFSHEEEIITGLQSLVGKIRPQIQLINQWAPSLKDDSEKSDLIQAKVCALQELVTKVVANTNNLLKSPPEGNEMLTAKKMVLSSLEKLSMANKQVVRLSMDSTDDMFEGHCGKVSADCIQLKAAIKSGDVPTIAQSLAAYKLDLQDSLFLAELVKLDLDDEKLLNNLLSTSNTLASQLDNLLPAVKAFAGNPNSVETEKVFDEYLSHLTEDLEGLVHLTDLASPEDQMMFNSKSLGTLTKNCLKNLENKDFAKAQTKMKDIKKKTSKQLQLSALVSSHCETSPELAQQITEQVSKLENLRNDLEGHVIKLQKDPTSRSALSKVKAACNQFRKQAELTSEISENIKTCKKEAAEKEKEKAKQARLAEEERV